MGLKTLAMILKKRGSEYVTEFLNEEITITEKLDTYRILFEKQEDKLVFFKKDKCKFWTYPRANQGFSNELKPSYKTGSVEK